MLNLLFRCQLQKIKKFFSTKGTAKLITLACFILLFAVLGWGIYLFFVEGFSYINSYPFFAQAITLYSYEIYLLFIFLLVVISSFISSIFSLFKKQENDWIMATPSYKVFPGLIFINTLFGSLWPLVIIVLPSLLAAHTIFGLKGFPLLFSLLTIIFLTIFTVSIMLLITLIVSKSLQILSSLCKVELLNFKNLITGIMILIFTGCVLVWYQSFSVDLVSLFKAQNLEATSSSVVRISNNFIYSPTHPVAKTIYEFQTGNVAGGYYYAFIVLFMTVVALSFLWLATEWFLSIWQRLQEGTFTAETQIKEREKRKSTTRLGGSPTTVLFKKEILVTRRNARDLLWFGFLLFIWLIQTGVNLVLSENITKYGIDTDLFPVIAHVLQFLTGVFFISAFVLRFAFPSFSMEKDTAWILGSIPINRSGIFWSKLLFYLPLFLVIGIFIGYTNLLILEFSLTASVVAFALFASALAFVIVLGVTLGAMFPSFETDDPSILSTSLPGIGFIIGVLTYGALGAFLLFKNLTANTFWPLLLFLITTYVVMGILMYIASASLRSMEFVKDRS